jgi:hypothetical protein
MQGITMGLNTAVMESGVKQTGIAGILRKADKPLPDLLWHNHGGMCPGQR